MHFEIVAYLNSNRSPSLNSEESHQQRAPVPRIIELKWDIIINGFIFLSFFASRWDPRILGFGVWSSENKNSTFHLSKMNSHQIVVFFYFDTLLNYFSFFLLNRGLIRSREMEQKTREKILETFSSCEKISHQDFNSIILRARADFTRSPHHGIDFSEQTPSSN